MKTHVIEPSDPAAACESSVLLLPLLPAIPLWNWLQGSKLT